MYSLISFGAVVRKLRTEKGYSQEQFAEAVNLHRTYISDIERGLRNISFNNIISICDALDVKPSELFRRVEENEGIR